MNDSENKSKFDKLEQLTIDLTGKFIKIETLLERVLNHQIESKTLTASLLSKSHEQDLKIERGDKSVKEELTEKIYDVDKRVDTHRAVAVMLLVIAAPAIGWCFSYIFGKI